ncbi:peptide ABC transporter ATP-binding protein [Asaia krungthepensis NRIC 0535]|uniref:Peptide ABC transporter ATP-binding protein n=2 Tax=Asaia krungthepensis TaxID=220990 RepID=A0ABQ0PZE0_9PROT|nr:peptide ABC transporter ATP-binding protein [Asaia krungthepensis NRIC 0535]
MLLQANELARTYTVGSGGKLRAVDDVSLALARGEALALVGESGCGKSTLGRLLMGFDRPDRGQVIFEGQDLATLSTKAMRVLRGRLQMVFQDSGSAFNPRWTIGQALAEPFRIHKRPWSRQSLTALLERVGLSPAFYDRYPAALSGGQRQRLNIARAIALAPQLIVADEPVSALDVSVQAQIINLLRDLQADLDLACLFISHDLAVVRQIADRMAVMYLGGIVEEGETLSVLAVPFHPYTRALVDAVPQPGKPLGAPLQGDVPSPLSPPPGCRFHTRCPIAQPRCAAERPALIHVGDGRKVACHYPLAS